MATILIVDDDEMQRELMAGLMKKLGNDVLEASNGKEAIQVLEKATPELILLDIMMPVMDGIETCMRIKEVEPLKSVPVVMLTALDSDENIIRALDAGADDFINKTSSIKVIERRISAHLRVKALYDAVGRIKSNQAAVMDVMLEISSVSEVDTMLQILADRTASQVKGRVTIILVDDKIKDGKVVACSDSHDDETIEIDLNKYPEIKESLTTKRTVVIKDVDNDPLVQDIIPILKKLDISSLIVIPIIFHDEVMGTLLLRARGASTVFNEEDIRLCRIMAGAAGNAIKNASYISLLKEKGEYIEGVNKRLKEVDKEKSDFFAIASHELGAPLAVTMTTNEMLLEELFGNINSQQKEILENSLESCNQMYDLVNELQGLALVESGSLKLHLIEGSIGKTVANVVGKMTPLAIKRGMTFTIADDMADVSLSYDPRRIEAVITNFVVNAIKHNEDGCDIVLGWMLEDDRCLVYVEDDGLGVSEDALPHIFEGYFRSTEQSKSRGLGLGLYISKKFVEAHGGEIWVEKARKKGSKFLFSLPTTLKGAG